MHPAMVGKSTALHVTNARACFANYLAHAQWASSDTAYLIATPFVSPASTADKKDRE
jgi:hypothetical protein